MKTFTAQELKDFILAQPKHRKINFSDCISTEGCGCLLVHFGRECLKIDENFCCSMNSILSRERHETLANGTYKRDKEEIASIIASGLTCQPQTYGSFVKYLKSQGKL